MTTLQLDFPPLRAEAERLAKEYLAADDHELPPFCTAPAHAVRAFARLLADLSRPESRDFWCRWLAGKLGRNCGLTAPSWWLAEDLYCPVERSCPNPDGECDPCDQLCTVAVWLLGNLDGGAACIWSSPSPGRPGEPAIPALAGITDPIDALRAAVLALGVDRA